MKRKKTINSEQEFYTHNHSTYKFMEVKLEAAISISDQISAGLDC